MVVAAVEVAASVAEVPAGVVDAVLPEPDEEAVDVVVVALESEVDV